MMDKRTIKLNVRKPPSRGAPKLEAAGRPGAEDAKRSAALAAPAIVGRIKDYREIVDFVNSIIVRTSTSGTVLFINAFGEKFFGYTKEEIVGKSVIGTLVPVAESSGRDLSRLMESIIQDPGTYSINENENIRKDGSRVWVLWTNRAVLDRNGRVVEVLSVGNEITARKEAETHLLFERDRLASQVVERKRELDKANKNLRHEVFESKQKDRALEETETRYRSLFENAFEGIFQTTDDGKYTMANDSLASMLGYQSPAEMMEVAAGLEPQLFVEPDRCAELKRLLASQGRVTSFEAELYRKDRERIWVSMNVRAVRNGSESLFYEGFVQDVTARQQNEEQMRRNFIKLHRVMEGAVKALSRAIEFRSPHTAGHQQKVAKLTAAIAEKLGFTREHTEAVYVAATVHDVGKILCPVGDPDETRQGVRA